MRRKMNRLEPPENAKRQKKRASNHSYKTIMVDLLTIVLSCFMLIFSQTRASTQEELNLPPVNLPGADNNSTPGETSMGKPVVSIRSQAGKKSYFLNEKALQKDELFKLLKAQDAKGVVLRGDKDAPFSWGELTSLNASLYESGVREIVYKTREGTE